MLDRDTPALNRLLLLARLGLGGTVGDGRQWFSWIHVHDWLTVARAALGLEPGLDLESGVVVAAGYDAKGLRMVTPRSTAPSAMSSLHSVGHPCKAALSMIIASQMDS